MKIKIEIVGVYPVKDRVSESQKTTLRNKFEELGVFLDCETIQNLIGYFRGRVGLKTVVAYENFDQWAKTGIMHDALSKEELSYLYDLNYDIEYISNAPSILSIQREDELKEKEEERIKWEDPYYTFTRALREKLMLLHCDKYFEIMLKAIVCGEVRNEDFPNHLVTVKSTREAIVLQRKCYWLYEDKELGYGRIADLDEIKQPLQTVRSQILEYKEKLASYNSTFQSI